MTKDSKIALVISATLLCLFIGWEWPIAWLLLIGGIVVLTQLPTKPTRMRQRDGADRTNTFIDEQTGPGISPDITRITQSIEAAVVTETNEDVKRGLRQALAIVRHSMPAVGEPLSQYVADRSPQVELSDAERAQQRRDQELRNVNIILYTASFLLVGAAITFIGVSEGVSDGAKFILLTLVAAGFYACGLVLHTASTRLKPAATAFVGTGLALIPFVGLALYSFVLPNGSLVWWLTSLVGLAAFVGAVSRIRSNVMSYLLLAFIFSLATSSVAVLQAPLVWYFVSVMVVGSGMTMLSSARPAWIGQEFTQPLEQNAQLAVPIALLGSLFVAGSFDAWDYTVILGVATIHYFVNAVGFSRDGTRRLYWHAFRGLLIAFAATFTFAVTHEWKASFFILLIGGLLTHAYAIRMPSQEDERAWLIMSQLLVASSLFIWYNEMSVVAAILGMLVLVSAHQLYVVRRIEHAAAGVVAAILLPPVVGLGVIVPAVSLEYIAAVSLFIGWLLLGIRAMLRDRDQSFRVAASLGYALFLVEALILGVASGNASWTAGVLLLLGLAVGLASYVERQPWGVVVANILCAAGIVLAYDTLLETSVWVPVASGLTLAAAWYGLRWYLVQSDVASTENTVRSQIMMVSAFVALLMAGLIGMVGPNEGVVASALVGCLAAGILTVEGTVRRIHSFYELAVYIGTFFLQRLVGFSYPDTHILVYSHWWAVTAGAAALLHYGHSSNRSVVQTRAVVSLILLTVPTGLYALLDPSNYQWLFLIEQVALIVVGALLNYRLFTMWGAIGVGLALLYMLQGYTYLLLALIAIGLIGLAVWRLMRNK